MGQSVFKKLFGTAIGVIITVIASTKERLAMLEPTTFPRAISEYPAIADWMLTINSGAEVAKETTVIPITAFGIDKFKERETEDFNNQSPPFIKSTNPTIIAKNAIF